eukprot:scaffold2.g6898.t1
MVEAWAVATEAGGPAVCCRAQAHSDEGGPGWGRADAMADGAGAAGGGAGDGIEMQIRGSQPSAYRPSWTGQRQHPAATAAQPGGLPNGVGAAGPAAASERGPPTPLQPPAGRAAPPPPPPGLEQLARRLEWEEEEAAAEEEGEGEEEALLPAGPLPPEADPHRLLDPALVKLRERIAQQSPALQVLAVAVGSPLPGDTRAQPYAGPLLDLELAGSGAPGGGGSRCLTSRLEFAAVSGTYAALATAAVARGDDPPRVLRVPAGHAGVELMVDCCAEAACRCLWEAGREALQPELFEAADQLGLPGLRRALLDHLARSFCFVPATAAARVLTVATPEERVALLSAPDLAAPLESCVVQVLAALMALRPNLDLQPLLGCVRWGAMSADEVAACAAHLQRVRGLSAPAQAAFAWQLLAARTHARHWGVEWEEWRRRAEALARAVCAGGAKLQSTPLLHPSTMVFEGAANIEAERDCRAEAMRAGAAGATGAIGASAAAQYTLYRAKGVSLNPVLRAMLLVIPGLFSFVYFGDRTLNHCAQHKHDLERAAVAGAAAGAAVEALRSEGEREVAALYARALSSLPSSAEERWVQTPTYGRAHVMVAGPADGPPLMLWQGAGMPGPYMLLMCSELVLRYRIYAPDTPCHCGRSDPVVLDPAQHEWGTWCVQVMEGLGLLRPGTPPPLHLGVSMGGCTILDLAAVAPETVRGAALLCPGGLHPALPCPRPRPFGAAIARRTDYGSRWHAWRLNALLFAPMALYMLWPAPWTAWAALWFLMDEPGSQDLVTQQLLLAFRRAGGEAGLGRGRVAGLEAPVLVIAAERDIFGGGAATAERARHVLHDCTAEVIPRARHCASAARMAAACQRVDQFFRERCGV